MALLSLQVYLGSGVKMAVVVTDAMVGPQWSDYCGKTFRSWVGESISEKGSISVHLGPCLALSARTGLGVSLIALTVSLHQTGESPHPLPAGTTHWSQQRNGLSTGQEPAGKERDLHTSTQRQGIMPVKAPKLPIWNGG